MTCSSSSWCFASEEEKAWWGGLWAERIVNSNLATTAKEHGIATQEQLEEMSMAFSEWKEKEEAWFACLHGEILCRRSG